MGKRKLSPKQLALIDDLILGAEDEKEVLAKRKVSRRLYRRWLCQESFADELRGGIEAARNRAILNIARGLPAAVNRLAKLVEQEEAPETARKACLDLLSLYEPVEGEQSRDRMSATRAAEILEQLAKGVEEAR
jgi:hypothetical protein